MENNKITANKKEERVYEIDGIIYHVNQKDQITHIEKNGLNYFYKYNSEGRLMSYKTSEGYTFFVNDKLEVTHYTDKDGNVFTDEVEGMSNMVA